MRAALAALVLSVLIAAPALAQETPLITGATQWLERPRDLPPIHPARTDLPANALVVLDCLVASDGRPRCSVLSEDPPGWGFGEAALRITRDYRMAPFTREGQPTDGRRYTLRVPFETR